MTMHSCNGCATNLVEVRNTVCGECAVRSLTADINQRARDAQELIKKLALENERLKRELAEVRKGARMNLENRKAGKDA